MPIDPFGGSLRVPSTGPFQNCLTVEPSDTDNLPIIPSAIMAAPDENGAFKSRLVTLVMQNGETAQILLPDPIAWGPDAIQHFRPKRIMSSGTTAERVVLLW